MIEQDAKEAGPDAHVKGGVHLKIPAALLSIYLPSSRKVKKYPQWPAQSTWHSGEPAAGRRCTPALQRDDGLPGDSHRLRQLCLGNLPPPRRAAIQFSKGSPPEWE